MFYNDSFRLKVFFLLASLISNVCYGAVSEEQALSFGNFAIADNSTVSSIVIPYSGANPTYTNKIYPLVHGQRGIYRLSAFPAFTPLTVTINNFSLQRISSTNLNIETFTHDTIVTDGAGSALMYLGATLKTTGDSGTYGDGNYTGNINITISW